MASAAGIRAGKAFTGAFADDSKLVRALRRGEERNKGFGTQASNMGRKPAGPESGCNSLIPQELCASDLQFLENGSV